MPSSEPYNQRRFLISRTDSIGDVVLTLPIAGVLKQLYPDCFIAFLGKTYTKPIIDCCTNIDAFLDWSMLADFSFQTIVNQVIDYRFDTVIHVFPNKKIAEISQKAKIPIRIGTRSRLYHWWLCNKRIALSRKKSDLHEAQLNLKLIEVLGAKKQYELIEIQSLFGFNAPKIEESFFKLIAKEKVNLILHPKSRGSAREWGMENFGKLIEILPENQYNIFITGTGEEGKLMQDFLKKYENKVHDLTGKMTLMQMIAFVNSCDAMLAASTGTLHIAAVLGKVAIGLFAPMRPIFPQRWAPIGLKARVLVKPGNCNDCRKNNDCFCIRELTPEMVLQALTT